MNGYNEVLPKAQRISTPQETCSVSRQDDLRSSSLVEYSRCPSDPASAWPPDYSKSTPELPPPQRPSSQDPGGRFSNAGHTRSSRIPQPYFAGWACRDGKGALLRTRVSRPHQTGQPTAPISPWPFAERDAPRRKQERCCREPILQPTRYSSRCPTRPGAQKCPPLEFRNGWPRFGGLAGRIPCGILGRGLGML